MLLDGPLKCETTASKVTIEISGLLDPSSSNFLNFSEFRIYQEREISDRIVKVIFNPKTMTKAFEDDNLSSTIGLTPVSDYKHAFFELIGKDGGEERESIHY